jgi:hypothetical protein
MSRKPIVRANEEGENMKKIEDIIKGLPPELQQEVEDFARFLSRKRVTRRGGKPKFKWAGALKDLKKRYNSVGLQHKLAEWRTRGNEAAD